MKFLRTQSFKGITILFTAGVFLALTLSITAVIHYGAKKYHNDQMTALISNTRIELADKLQEPFEEIVKTQDFFVTFLQRQIKDVKASSKNKILANRALHAQILTLLRSYIDTNPYINAIYLADAKGNLVKTQRMADYSISESTTLNKNSKVISHSQYYDLDKNPVYKETTKKSFRKDLDLRQQWWYKHTRDNGASWSETHKSPITKKYQTTYRFPIYVDDKLIGVMGIDMGLRSLKTVALKYLKKTPALYDSRTKVLVIDQDTVISDLGNPDHLGQKTSLHPDLKLLMQESEKGSVSQKASGKKVLRSDSKILTLTTKSKELTTQEYLGFLKTLDIKSMKNQFQLALIMPNELAQEELDRVIATIILILLGATLAMIFFMLTVGKKLTKPLITVRENLDRVSKLQFQDIVSLESSFYEFRNISHSTQNLQRMFAIFGKFAIFQNIKKLISKNLHTITHIETRQLSIMSINIKNFEEISKEHKFDHLLETLKKYFALYTKIIEDNNGMIEDVGNSIIVSWDESNCNLACKTALEIQKATKELHSKSGKDNLILETEIGLHYGAISVGYTNNNHHSILMGENIQKANKLSVHNGQTNTSILISGEMHQQIADNFIAKAITKTMLKDCKTPTIIYELIYNKDQCSQNLQKGITFHNIVMEKYYEIIELGNIQQAKKVLTVGLDAQPKNKVFIEHLSKQTSSTTN